MNFKAKSIIRRFSKKSFQNYLSERHNFKLESSNNMVSNIYKRKMDKSIEQREKFS